MVQEDEVSHTPGHRYITSQDLSSEIGHKMEKTAMEAEETSFSLISRTKENTKEQAHAEVAHPQHGLTPSSEETSPIATPANQQAMTPSREVFFIFIVCSSNIVTQAGLGMAIAPLNIIGGSFGSLGLSQLSWFVAAYALTVGTFILISGRLGDMFGHKLVFVAGLFCYGISSLITGFTAYSHSQEFFDVCRALQGIGPAMMVPNSLALLGRVFPPGRKKEMIFSIYGATAPNGFIFGAVFGSLLAQFAWWPWEFWIMAIVCCVLGLMAIVIVPSRAGTDSSRSEEKFDIWGAVTGVAGLSLFNVAWNEAPNSGWNAPHVLVLLILGVFLSISFLLIEARVDQPLIPKGALTSKVAFVLGCIALGWSSFGIWIFYLFQFIINLRHLTPLGGAAQAIPAGPAGVCAALSTGYILSRVPTALVMAFAMLAFFVGNTLLATMPIDQTYWIQTFLSIIITPWGMDMSFPASTIILSDLVPEEEQGIAASLVVTVVNYSISIGLGIAGTIEGRVNEGGRNSLRGYRGAFYAGMGTSGLGFLLATVFLIDAMLAKRKHRRL